MARQGRCKCGRVLQFQEGPQGFKTRCKHCNSVVRLRVDLDATRVCQPTAPASEEPETTDFEPPNPPVVEMEQWTTDELPAHRSTRLWWLAGLAVVAAGVCLGLVIWWLVHQGVGES
jgi:hypothetical protein